MKKLVIGMAVVSFLALVFYLMGYVLPYKFVSRETVVNNSNCRDAQMANKEHIEGLVKRKFRDKASHMWKTVEYSDNTGLDVTLIFRNDESGAYDFVMEGDSIVKRRGSMILQIFRNGEEIKYELDYGCN